MNYTCWTTPPPSPSIFARTAEFSQDPASPGMILFSIAAEANMSVIIPNVAFAYLVPSKRLTSTGTQG